MPKPPTAGAPLLAALVLLTAACAGPARMPGSDAGRPSATILIDNHANTITEMTVTLVPEFGVPKLLGTVRLNETKPFVVRPSVAGESYRLVAKPLGGARMISAPFQLSPGDRFEWDMRLNSIFFRGRTVAAR